MPKYNPSKWNKDIYTRESQNCYSYFLNKISKKNVDKCKRILKNKKYIPQEITDKTSNKKNACIPCPRPQPGISSGKQLKQKDYNCKELTKRILEDNKSIKKTSINKKCPKKYYKGIIIVKEGEHYHFIRQDDDNRYSHKDGNSYASRKIFPENNYNNNPVNMKKYINTKKKDFRKFYNGDTKYCNSFCIPRDNSKLKSKSLKETVPKDCKQIKQTKKISKKNFNKNNNYYFKYLDNPDKYKHNPNLYGYTHLKTKKK